MIKLSEITGLVGRVPKRGYNRAQNYHFAREGDVADMLRPLFSRRHLFLHQSVKSHELSKLFETQRGGTMWLTVLQIDFTWMDGDSKENLEAGTFTGYGSDTGDKGANKAMTSAAKYALLKSFNISTGEDSEADTRVDEEAAAAGAARSVDVQSGRQGRRQAAPGGRQQEASAPAERSFRELLVAAGAGRSEDAAVLIGTLIGQTIELNPEDKAGSLAAFLTEYRKNGQAFGKLVYDLRKHVEERQPQPAGETPAQTVAATSGDPQAEMQGSLDDEEDSLAAGSAY